MDVRRPLQHLSGTIGPSIGPIALPSSWLTGAGAQAGLTADLITPIAVTTTMTVQGAHVNVVAQWNEAKSETGRYQAPQGYVIRSATPVVRSELRSSSHVAVSADRRE